MDMNSVSARGLRQWLREHRTIELRNGGESPDAVITMDCQRFADDVSEDIRANTDSVPDPIRRAIAELVLDFHSSASTLTTGVETAVARLKAGAPILHIFHQANTLASLNISGLSILADHLAELIETKVSQRPVVLFLLLDYDSADDQRFRNPSVPDWTRASAAQLITAVPSRFRHQIAASVPTPSDEVVASWRKAIEDSARFWSCLIPMSASYAERQARYSKYSSETPIGERLSAAYRDATSLCLANSWLTSYIINSTWNLDTLILPASRLLQIGYPRMLELLESRTSWFSSATSGLDTYPREVGAFLPPFNDYGKGLVWRVCDRCFARARSTMLSSPEDMTIQWQCAHCGHGGHETIKEFKSFDVTGTSIPRLIPAVTIDEILDSAAYGLRYGIQYAGGLSHLIRSRSLNRAVGLQRSYDLAWDPINFLFRDEILEFMRRHYKQPDIAAATEVANDLSRGRFAGPFYACAWSPSELRAIMLC
jgi:hypothetical protein